MQGEQTPATRKPGPRELYFTYLLIALAAPRAVFVTGGTQDQWADPKGEFLAQVAAGPVAGERRFHVRGAHLADHVGVRHARVLEDQFRVLVETPAAFVEDLADAHARCGERGALGRDRKITSGNKLASSRRRHALHLGNHGLWNRLDLLHQFRADGEDLTVVLFGASGHLTQIVSSAEGRTRGCKDDSADGAISFDLREATD